MASYELTLRDPYDAYLATLDAWTSLDYALTSSEVGVLALVLPPSYDARQFVKDSRIIVERRIGGTVETTTWLISLVDATDERTAITAFAPVELLTRRIVVEAAESRAVGVASDDLMKLIVTQNFVTPFDPDRTMPLISVAASTASAPVVTMEFANREVLDILREIANASAAAGTFLAFDLVPVPGGFEFRTYVGVRGTDRTVASGDPLVLSEARGTLTNVSVSNNWSDEKTAVYARGSTSGSNLPALATDAERIAQSPFGRRESYLLANGSTALELQDAAAAELRSRRGREQFEADMQEQAGLRYDVDVHFGDLVTAEEAGLQYTCRVDTARITMDASGQETVAVHLRNAV